MKEIKTKKKIPVTVITGFLGSGKTTLINRILTEEHGIRFAVIENEFGEVGIDQDLVLNEKEEVIEMNNGCICCTVRGDLIRIIKKLVTSENPPDHILIETTGLADPSPVAQTFLTDPEIAATTFLDAIVTLVDAKHIESQLISTPEAKDQIAFADIVLLNKVDLVTGDEKHVVENRIREINRFAQILYAEKGNIDLKTLFNVGGFDIERALSINPRFMEIEYPFEYGAYYKFEPGRYTLTASPNGEEQVTKIILAEAPEDHSLDSLKEIANPAAIIFSSPFTAVSNGQVIKTDKELQQLVIEKVGTTFTIEIPQRKAYVVFTEHMPFEFEVKIEDIEGVEVQPFVVHEFRPAHTHDEAVNSVGVEIEGELDPQAFLHFINTVINVFGNELYRYKGIVAISGEKNRIVLQGVHMLFEMQPAKIWQKDEVKKNTIIFIGKNLDRNIITQGFLSCLRQ